MGYNTTIVVLNDCLSYIEKEKEFGKKLSDAISHASLGKYAETHKLDISAGPCINAATVIESHHADQTTIIAVGGNCGTQLHQTFGFKHHEKETQLRYLKEMAKELGYTLHKNPKK